MTSAPRRPLRAARLAAWAGPVLAAVLLPAGSVAAAPPPATCGALDLTDTAAVVANAEGTDDVFIGRVVSLDTGTTTGGASASATPSAPASTATGGSTPTPGTGRAVRHEVLVEDALTGDLRPGQPVRVVFSAVGGKQTQLRLNANYVFFTTGAASALSADGCDGYASARALDAATVDTLRDALAPDESAGDVVLSEPAGGSDGPPDLGRVIAPGGAVALVGVLGLVLLTRVGRRR